jgi:DNA-binding XRE family transcriptional regulator
MVHTMSRRDAPSLPSSRDARRRCGWSLREAGRNVGVAHGTIAHLEKARRAPSVVVARNIIRTYRLTDPEAAMLRAEAVEGAGWDSPFEEAELGIHLDERRGAPSVLFGARGYSLVHGLISGFYGAQEPRAFRRWRFTLFSASDRGNPRPREPLHRTNPMAARTSRPWEPWAAPRNRSTPLAA